MAWLSAARQRGETNFWFLGPGLAWCGGAGLGEVRQGEGWPGKARRGKARHGYSMKVLNLGAGVQSTTVYLMAVRGDIQIDHAIFADTGEEPGDVYKHLAWLRSLNGPPIHVVYNGQGRLGDDLIYGQHGSSRRFATIPAFIQAGPNSQRGQARRQCTYEYKIRPIENIYGKTCSGLFSVGVFRKT